MQITVTAQVQYVYDTDETQSISTQEEALDDVWEMIANGEVTPDQFTFTAEVAQD